MIKVLNWDELSLNQRQESLQRPLTAQSSDVETTVRTILNEVKTQGDNAVLGYSKKFDCSSIDQLVVTADEIESAYSKVDKNLVEAIQVAIQNIKTFHQAQIPNNIKIETTSGVTCEKRFVPIEKVGLYIPGGSAPLPSTLIMLAVPAQIAGCKEIYLTTPAQKNGLIDNVVLATAKILGLNKIFKVGGAQAIAALAYGTQTIPKVNKIFGPGNAWVTEAKVQVALDPQGAAIDMPAGPSEVLVIADKSANPKFVAADLLSQAEHDPSSQVILIATDKNIIQQTQQALEEQVTRLSRKKIILEALASSRAFLVNSLALAMEISNLYAPEHLILQIERPQELANQVQNAGSVFLGHWAPESMGDYASGTNHVLPTYGFARAFSGLSLESFMKSISFQEATYQGLLNLGPVVRKLAEAEGLDAHANSVSLRLSARST